MAALTTLGAACSPTSEHDAPTSRGEAEVQGGFLDNARAHDFAVLVTTTQDVTCSGTLIAPNLVLTARHCVMPKGGKSAVTCADTFSKGTTSPLDIRVTTSPTLREATKVYGAREITIPDDDSFCGNDIALVTLSSNVPPSEAVPATPLVTPMTDRSLVSDQVAVVGYGVTEPTLDDSGFRRKRERIDIICVPGDDRYDCREGYGTLLGSDREFITDGYVCSGDSGGGAFEQASFEFGTPFVLGALSRGPETETDCLAAIYTRTDAHAALIAGAAVRAAALGRYPIPGWAAPDGVPLGETECLGNICTSVSGTNPADANPSSASCAVSSSAPSRRRSNLPSNLPVTMATLTTLALLLRARRAAPVGRR